MHPTSKGFRRFKSRIEYFQDDLELVTLLSVKENFEHLKSEEGIFVGVNKQHPNLSRRTNNVNSRNLVVAHLRKTVYVAYIKEVYEEVLLYCKYIINQAAKNSTEAKKLISSENNITLKLDEILGTNYDEIIETAVGKIFRQIENKKDTPSLIKALNERLTFGIEDSVFTNALQYLEIRHLLIHNDGVADEMFKSKYPNIKIDSNNKVKLSLNIIKAMTSSVTELVKKYENSMVNNKLFCQEEYE